MMILRYILLGLATAATALVIVGILRGNAYTDLVANLDDDQYPLHDLYGLGFFLSSIPALSLHGSLERDLKHESHLYWDNIYYEYYAELAWAEFLTFSTLILAVGLAVGALFEGFFGLFVLIFVAVCIGVVYNEVLNKMKDAVKERSEECEYAFPDMVVKFALLVSSGMISRTAWYTVAYGHDEPLYQLMQRACHEMDNGSTEVEAIRHFGVLTDSETIKKFTSAMTQSLERGGSDLAGFLMGQTTELLAHKRQLALQRGEVAAAKLTAPVAMMFVGVIIIVLGSVLQGMGGMF